MGCLSNYPFFILPPGLLIGLEGSRIAALAAKSRLLSDVVEGFGANLPLLVLPYVLDWIVGKEAAEELVGSAAGPKTTEPHATHTLCVACDARSHLLTYINKYRYKYNLHK